MRAVVAVCCIAALLGIVLSQDPSPNPYPEPGPEPGPVPIVPEDRYECSSGQCQQTAEEGGVPFADCQQTCGKTTNSTPSELIGSYRGIQVDNLYQIGEWRAVIDQRSATILNPMGQVWARGSMIASSENLGINTPSGFLQGLRSWLKSDQVGVFTWALGGANQPGPTDFDSAMLGKANSTVFVFARCLATSPYCNFSKIDTVLKEKRAEAAKPTPGVPAAIKGKIYRGLQISQKACAGEFRVAFGTSTVSITPPKTCGSSLTYKVSTVGDFRMWWTKPNSPPVKVLWKLEGGVATEFLTLAANFGKTAGPKNFSAGMQMNEFILAGCQEPYPNSPQTCIFK